MESKYNMMESKWDAGFLMLIVMALMIAMVAYLAKNPVSLFNNFTLF